MPTTNKSIFRWLRHFIWMMASTLASAGAAFLLQIVLARHLPVESYALIVLAVALANFLQPIGNFGLPWLLAQTSGDRAEIKNWFKASSPVMAFGLSCAIAITIGYASFTLAHAPLSRLVLIGLFLPAVFAQPLLEIVTATCQVRAHFLLVSVLQAYLQVARLLAVVILIVLNKVTIGSVLTAYAVVALVGIAISVWVQLALTYGHRERGPPSRETIARHTSREVVMGAFPYFLMTLSSIGFAQAAILVMGKVADRTAVAHFNISYLILSAFFLLPTVIYSKLLLPTLARLAVSDRNRFQALITVGLPAMGSIGLLAYAAILVGGRFALAKLFGASYGQAFPTLAIMALAIPARFFGSPFASVMMLRNSMAIKVCYHLVSGTIFIALLLFLAPRYGAQGAGLAFAVSEFVLAFFGYLSVRRGWPEIRRLEGLRPRRLIEASELLLGRARI